MGEAHTRLRVERQIGSLKLAVELALAAPWTVIFGASGSGKSTLLRMIAGLTRPNTGHIAIEGQTVFDSVSRIDLPSALRPVRWAGQRAALFPRKTVLENLACAESERGSGEAIRALEHFELRELAHVHPDQLSGGQQQRVATARAALSARGKLLLLDEPFSGLDAEVRATLIEQLRTWLGATPVISVTHDPEEAFLLGAHVVRLAEGTVVAEGPVAEVLAPERERLRRTLG